MSDTRILDLHYLGKPGRVCAALLPTRSGFLLVDCGPALTVPALLDGLAAHQFDLSQLRAVLLTHIHLDHAGAAGDLARLAPQARIYVHAANGAPHLQHPEKLLSSVRRLYGGHYESLFGLTQPVPQSQLAPLSGGEALDIDGRRIQVLATPGHASHHLAFFDPETRLLFTGDAAGLRRTPSAPVLPYTPPPDIDLPAWSASLDSMRRTRPHALLLTHYGLVEDPEAHLRDFESTLAQWAAIARDIALSPSELEQAGLDFQARLGPEPGLGYEFVADISHCGRGLVRYWRKSLLSSSPN